MIIESDNFDVHEIEVLSGERAPILRVKGSKYGDFLGHVFDVDTFKGVGGRVLLQLDLAPPGGAYCLPPLKFSIDSVEGLDCYLRIVVGKTRFVGRLGKALLFTNDVTKVPEEMYITFEEVPVIDKEAS